MLIDFTTYRNGENGDGGSQKHHVLRSADSGRLNTGEDMRISDQATTGIQRLIFRCHGDLHGFTHFQFVAVQKNL